MHGSTISQDTDTLIRQEDNNVFFSSIGAFFSIHYLPILIFIFFFLFRFNFLLFILIGLITAVLDFYLTKNFFGYNLVGLRWYYDSSEAPNFPHIVFFSRPLPFVASTKSSNAFWLGLFINFGLLIIVTIISFVLHNFYSIFLGCLTIVLALFNVWGFMKCHNLQQIKADNAIRSVLLDTNDAFKKAKESDADEDSTENEESIEEDDVNNENIDNTENNENNDKESL